MFCGISYTYFIPSLNNNYRNKLLHMIHLLRSNPNSNHKISILNIGHTFECIDPTVGLNKYSKMNGLVKSIKFIKMKKLIITIKRH